MSVTVHLTQMLVKHLNAKGELSVDADDLGDMLNEIDKVYEGFRDSVCDEAGSIRKYVNVFVNGLRVGGEKGVLSTSLGDGDEVHVLASVAGGAF